MKTSTKFYIIGGLVLIFLFLIGLNITQYRNLKTNETLNQQNISALTSRLKIESDKNNELITSKESMSLTIDQLKKVNNDLYQKLKNSKQEIEIIQQTNIQYKEEIENLKLQIQSSGRTLTQEEIDNLFLKYLDKNKNAFKINWSYSKSENDVSYSFDGYSIFNVVKNDKMDSLMITNVHSFLSSYLMNLKLYTGIQKNKSTGLYEAFAQCKNKNIQITSLESNIDPEIFYYQKPSRWSLGLHVGVQTGLGFSLNNMQGVVYTGIGIGLGLNYSLWNF
jgi:hypothetical protein